MTTEQANMLKAIYDNQNIPSGMYRLVLTSFDIASLLTNTIIDYTKLTSDNFSIRSCYAYGGVSKTNPFYGNGFTNTTTCIPNYNPSTGVLSCSVSDAYRDVGSYGTVMASLRGIECILNCDIRLSLKTNWKDFV